MTVSERLREVRIGMKLKLKTVSTLTGLGVSTLSDFETGRREPRLGQLKQLADAYHRPVAYFLDDSAPRGELVLWRERPTSPRAEVLGARLIELADQYRTLEVLCEQPPQIDLPQVAGAADGFGYSEAGRLAHRVRSELGLGDRPGQTLLRIMEEVSKIKVFHFAFEPSVSAACTLAGRYGAAVLLNSRNVRWRRTFDLAHELFHLLAWRIFRHDTESDSALPSPTEEKLATCFARNLLMPEEVLRRAVEAQRSRAGTLGFDGLFEVAREFDVSVDAVLWQMGFVYNIPSKQVQAYLRRIRDRIGYWDQREHDNPPERPLRFLALARQALRRGLISTGRYAQLAGVPRREAMRAVEEDAREDAEIEVAHS
jgi:Zn-dependent peptidase ImmA (M78 family)/transcriptional regulator with XRE-family HTH domain